jgi:hypothetical protein
MGLYIGMVDQVSAEEGTQGPFGDVVLGRAQPTRDQHDVCTASFQRAKDLVLVVTHNPCLDRPDAHKPKLLPDPGRIGVHCLADQQLIANAQAFCRDFPYHGLLNI